VVVVVVEEEEVDFLGKQSLVAVSYPEDDVLNIA
jgi:hypothetical protein